MKNLLYNTQPNQIHGNGFAKRKPLWQTFVRNRNLLPPLDNDAPNLVVCCYNTAKGSILQTHCRDNGVEVLNLATVGIRYEKWNRYKMLIEYCKTTTFPLVLFVDAADSLLVGKLSNLTKVFEERGCELLFSAEKNHFPARCPTKEFEQAHAKAPYCYLNAGGCVGKAEFIAYLDTEWKPVEDQGWCKSLYQNYYPKIQVDDSCRAFQCLYGVGSEELCI